MDESSLQLATAAGIHIHVVPFIRTVIREDTGLQAEINALPDQGLTAVFTSRNGVTGAIQQLTTVPQWSIACIEGKTRQASEQFFGKAAIIATAADAGQLATELIRMKTKAVVFFCGDRRLDHLPESLDAAGINVQEIIVYHTEAIEATVQDEFKGILFFSPSAVTSFFKTNTLAPDCTVFAIGPTTAKTLSTYTSNTIIISPQSDEGAMIRQLINYYNEERPIT